MIDGQAKEREVVASGHRYPVAMAMIKARLFFVPPGGEEQYGLNFELPAVPQAGDYITVVRPAPVDVATFIVRRSWWYLKHGNDGTQLNDASYGTLESLGVECEYARGAFSSEEHNRDSGKDAKFLEVGSQFPSHEQ